jgi:hypothetical protein
MMEASASKRFPLGLLFVGLLASLIFLLMAIPKKWEEATKVGDDGAITLSDDWAETIEKKISTFEIHELYSLMAAKDGYYACKHCPGGKFFLKKFEIYRYGTTGVGKSGRGYNENWQNDNFLIYSTILTSDLKTVKIAQTSFIGAYPLLRENLERPLLDSPVAKPYWFRLVLPPGNNSLD